MVPLSESHSARIRYAGRYLSRPLFLEAEELSGLERDLSLVRSALRTLPQRLFDGNLRALGRAVGMTELQTECVLRSRGPGQRTVTGMGRADLYRDADGFRLLEWNLGSPTGGIECVDTCRALLAVPEMAAFVAKEGLVYADSYEAMLTALRFETGFPDGTEPVVALVEAPGDFAEVEPLMNDKAARFTDRGLPSMVGHLGELARENGRLCLRGEPIDVVFRMFTFEDVLGHIEDGLLEPLLAAAERGEVAVFTPLDAELFGNKTALALLSDPAGQVGLAPEQQEACARMLPWSRQVRAGETSLEDGRTVDLLTYASEHQDDLVLKPSLSYGGSGVVVGADPDVTPAMWRDLLAQAADSFYVVQRLVRPVPELFPSAAPAPPTAYKVAWGVFMTEQGYAGNVPRGVPVGAPGVVNFTHKEALTSCSFHAPAR
ncbi:hypothetical protein [Streptomyces lincolnensis]|uniref:hypothetical protein n=1 Tax=Streptomyces lincolnensis TaxID=1915 RepID=UPI0037CF8C10